MTVGATALGAATAVLAAALVWAFGPRAWPPTARAGDGLAALAAGGAAVVLAGPLGVAVSPAAAGLLAVLAAAGAIDAHTRRIPNPLSGLALAAALAAALPASWPLALAGGVAVMLCALAAWRFGGMGMGDVKLLTAVGVALGPVVGITAFALAAATGVAWHAAGAVRGPKRRARFAFAPFIAIAVAACLIAPRLLVALAAGHAA